MRAQFSVPVVLVVVVLVNFGVDAFVENGALVAIEQTVVELLLCWKMDVAVAVVLVVGWTATVVMGATVRPTILQQVLKGIDCYCW